MSDCHFPFAIDHERVCKALQLPCCKDDLCLCDSIKGVGSSKSQCSTSEFRELTLKRRMEITSHNICEFERVVDRELNNLIHMVNSFSPLDSRIQKVLKLFLWLFSHHTRQCAFEKQKEVALRLYNPFVNGEMIPLWPLKEEKFILWAACSLHLQELFGDYPGQDLLASSIGLLSEHLRSQGLLLPEGPLLYISILEKQGMYAEALDFLSSLGEDNVDRLHIKGRLLARSQDYASAAKAFQAYLVQCPDDWGCFTNYLDCLLEVDSMWHGGFKLDQVYLPQLVDRKISKLSGPEFELRMANASDFIGEFNAVTEGNINFRDLAFMEIECRRMLQLTSNGDQLIIELSNYFRRFGHLANFTSIAALFLGNMAPSKGEQLVENFKNIIREYQGDKDHFQIILRTINMLKVQEALMFRFDCNRILESVESFCSTITRIYFESLRQLSIEQSVGRLSDSTIKNGIELIGELPSMACNILVQLFWRTQKIGYLLEAILVLEFSLVMQSSNPQHTVQLIHLYSHAGALKLAHERYTMLNIGGILLETMSHHVWHQMLTSTLWDDSLKLLEDYEAFTEYHIGELADMTIRGYCCCDFPSVVEGTSLMKMLQHSHKRVLAKVEKPILHLKKHANDFRQVESLFEEAEGIQWEEIIQSCKSSTFNNNLQTRPWWTPIPDFSYLLKPYVEDAPRSDETEMVRQWKGKVAQITKRRGLIPFLIRLSVERGLFLKDGSLHTIAHSQEFSVRLSDYAFSLLHGGVGDGRLKDKSIKRVALLITRVCEGKMRFKWPISDIIDWLNFAVFLNAWTCGPLDRIHHSLFSPDVPPSGWEFVNILMGSFAEAIIQEMQTLGGSPGSGHDFGLLVQIFTESMAWHVFIIRAFYQAIVPPPAARRYPDFISEVNLIPVSYDMLGSLKSCCATLNMVIAFLGRFVSSRSDALEQCQAEFTDGPGEVYELLKKQEVGDLWSPESPDATFTRLLAKQKESWSHLQGICIAKRKLLIGLRNDLQRLI